MPPTETPGASGGSSAGAASSGGASSTDGGSTGTSPDGFPTWSPDLTCDDLGSWPSTYAEDEEAVYFSVVGIRAAGFDCQNQSQGLTNSVERSSALTCSSRLHSLDMYSRDFFDTMNPDGQSPLARMNEAGLFPSISGEIVRVSTDPENLAREIFDEAGADCEVLVNPDFSLIGISRVGDLWTLDFAAP